MLADAVLLVYPRHGVPLSIACDASDTAMGGVLQQLVDGRWQPLAFFSKKFSARELGQEYGTYDRELLAIYSSIIHFQHFVDGREFHVLTDHKPLTFAFTRKSSTKLHKRRETQLSFISQFTTDIRHISGSANTVADTLSRVDAMSTADIFINFDEMASAQETDGDLLRERHSNESSLVLKQIPVAGSSTHLWCDTKTGVQRPFVPASHRRKVFESLHNLSHDGVRTTVRKIAERFVWPGMNKEISLWTRACPSCQRSKVHRHTQSAPGSFSLPDKRFEHIHIDLITMTECQGMRYCLTVVDRFTRWPQAIPLPNMEAETCARALMSGWIAHYGIPLIITSDQGRQFESHLFQSLCRLLGARRVRTVAFHPESNGLVERMHRSLKTAIKAREESNWVDSLPLVLLGLRTAFKEDLLASAAEMVYGMTLRLPGSFLTPTAADVNDGAFIKALKETMDALRPVPTSSHDTTAKIFIHPDLFTCSHALVRVDRVRKPDEQPFEGPYEILRRTDKFFLLRIGRREVNVSVDRLRPFFQLHCPTTQPHTSTSDAHTQSETPTPPPVMNPADPQTPSPGAGAHARPESSSSRELSSEPSHSVQIPRRSVRINTRPIVKYF